jgi:hypothetical protein
MRRSSCSCRAAALRPISKRRAYSVRGLGSQAFDIDGSIIHSARSEIYEKSSWRHTPIPPVWVEDIQSAYRVLSSLGVRFEAKPHLVARRDNNDLWMAFLRDVDNNLLALMSEVPRI